jgi:DNA (cytosine-5)-methyltransferase 1
MEFGADYPFEDRTPYAIGAKELAHYHGSMGIPLGELKEEHRFDGLPSYARTKEDRFPDWIEYSIDYRRLSPHNFGIPQIRDRVYIVGSKSGLEDFVWPEPQKVATSILSAIEKEPADAKPLSHQVIDCLNVWQQFISLYPKSLLAYF